ALDRRRRGPGRTDRGPRSTRAGARWARGSWAPGASRTGSDGRRSGRPGSSPPAASSGRARQASSSQPRQSRPRGAPTPSAHPDGPTVGGGAQPDAGSPLFLLDRVESQSDFSIVSASLTSNLPGCSTLTALTTPLSTSIE